MNYRGIYNPTNKVDIDKQADIISKKIIEKQMQIHLMNEALKKLGVNLEAKSGVAQEDQN